MTTQANHHPAEALLREFNAGQLSTGMSVAISAHLEVCGHCRQASNVINTELAHDWMKLDLSSADSSAGSPGKGKAAGEAMAYSGDPSLLSRITSQPQAVPVSPAEASVVSPVELHVHERSIKLPRILSKAAQTGVVWRKLAGGINSAKLILDREAQCDFMYMKPGSQAPSHTHRGVEVTLVLDGTFEDELGTYIPGDFILRQSDQTHTPRSDEGCLCYSVLDSPLLFTSGWARLLNPFQRFLFDRQLRAS